MVERIAVRAELEKHLGYRKSTVPAGISNNGKIARSLGLKRRGPYPSSWELL